MGVGLKSEEAMLKEENNNPVIRLFLGIFDNPNFLRTKFDILPAVSKIT